MRVWLCCAGAALTLASFCARAEENVSPEVVSVEVSGSRAPFELDTRPGEAMDPAKLREDVKRLWASGRFEDVRVESTADDDGVRLVFRVTEKKPLRLRKVEVTPATPNIDPGLEADSPVDSWRAQAAAAAIRAQLVAQGYPEAKAEAQMLPVDSGRADVNIAVDRGKHVRVRDVAFSGRLGAEPGELRKALQATKSRTILPGIWRLRPGYSEDAVEADAANLKSLLYHKGYFNSRVGLDSLERDGRDARLSFRIDSGPQYAVRSLNIYSPGGSLRPIRPGPGGQFPARDVCRAFFDERRKAERAGVIEFDARLEISELPDSAAAPGFPKRADIAARVELGPAYRIGRIEFRGNRAFSDIALRRSMLLDEGQPADSMLLRKTLARLNRTGLFEPLSPANIVLNTAPGAEEADLTIHVREKKRGHWALSGPVGPLNIAGPLQFAIGSRLPSWGRGIFEMSTYTASISFMTFAQPMARFLPFLPDKRFMLLGALHRPMLPGQRFTSGFVIAPQLGWQGMLLGYGMSQSRDLMGGPLQGEHQLTPPLEVKITRGAGPDAPIEGIMLCELPATKLDRLRQVGSVGLNLVFAMSPF